MPTLMNCPQIFDKLRKSFLKHIWLRRMLFGVIGAVLGFSYYLFIGCYNGTCLISSNPYISTLYGAGIGLIITPSKKKTGE
jgi:uncharacterized protein YacL